MIDTRRTRPSLGIGLGLAVAGIVTASYAFISGCGAGQEAPPNTPAQTGAQAESVAPDDAGGPGSHHHRLPPPAAFEACRAKGAGDACTVDMQDREVSGKCAAPPPGSSQTTLACRPEGGPRHKTQGPRPEIVFAACDGKAAGDACTVTFERGTVQGSCMAPRHDAGAERLLCAAAHRHGPGSGNAGEVK
ncbi:MAG: hypothetical protein JWO86_8331 [Myxococcaceae bacterium]|nr:hypothetical protein [Myxococcaceae bacterium]